LSEAPNDNPSPSYHLRYGVAPDTGERAPPSPQPDRQVLGLPTPEGWKAELILVLGYV